ncbi:ATP-dependent helicase, partial [Pseudomonas aeruginosa]
MLGRFFSGKDRSQPTKGAVPGAYQIEEEGLCYALSLADDDASWPVAAYLDQLFEEDYASQLSDRWLLPWESIYQLLDDPEHASSLPLLGLPAIANLQPQLASTGGLSDPDFKVFIRSWRNPQTGNLITFERVGAVARYAETTELLSRAVWELLKAIRDLHATQQQAPGEVANQIGWANIRKLAKRAGAGLDGFLDKTVVVKPEHLRLKPRKAVVAGTPIIELDVAFDGQPDNWLASFDGYKQVQDKYRVPGADGTVTHVLIEPDVKAVLESVRALPGRRVAGDEALSLVRNPYSVIGDAAEKVVDADEYEEQLADAGIYFHRFRLEPCLGEDGKHIQSIGLFLEPISSKPLPEIELRFDFAHEFAPFVNELQMKLAAGMPAGFWQGYELELSDF